MSQTADRLVQWLRQRSWTQQRTAEESAGIAPSVLSELGGQGLLGMHVGVDHGGPDLCHREAVRILDQLGSMDLAASLFVGLNNYLGVHPILRHGQARLRDELLPPLARGDRFAGFAFAEPAGGVHSERWSSNAEPVNGSGWMLSGTKSVSGSLRASSILTAFVRHRERDEVSAFVTVPKSDTAALSGPIDVGELSRETIQLDGTFVASHRMLGARGQGMQIAFEAIRLSHVAIGAACLGGMKRCSQLIFEHATRRQVSTTSFVPHPVTITRLGRITAEIASLECLIQFLAEVADTHREVAPLTFSVCRVFAPTMLSEAVDDLVQLLGRRGLGETPQVRRLVDDARTLRGLEGPRENAAAALGAQLLNTAPGSLEALIAGVFELDESDPLVAEAGSALLERALGVGAEADVAERHWLEAQAGDLVSWSVLLGAVQRRRRTSPSADLERGATWIRSNLERAIAAMRAGAPGSHADSRSPAGSAPAAAGILQRAASSRAPRPTISMSGTELGDVMGADGTSAATGEILTDPAVALRRLATASERMTRLPVSAPAGWLYHETYAAIHDVGAAAEAAELSRVPLEEMRQVTEHARALVARHSALFRHMQDWPHGYPGDFEIVERICEGGPRGELGSLEYALDSYVLNLPIVQQHRAKVAWQAQLVRQKLGTQAEVRVLSVACGGSRDLILLEPNELGRLRLVLVDLEEGAVALSASRLRDKARDLVTIQGNVLRNMERLRENGPYDVVLIGGLLDYLPERLARGVLSRVFRMVNPGAVVGATNLAVGNPWRLLLAMFTNWVLIERSEQEMRQLFEGFGSSFSMSRDQTGLTWLARGEQA